MRLEVPRTYLHLHEQAIKPRKGGSKDRKVDIIIYPHLPGGEEGIEELANSLPHPPAASCLPAGGGPRVAAVALCGRPAAVLPLSPPGIPSSSRGVDRGSQGWAQQARSGPVGGLVWFGFLFSLVWA